ncbi:MAG: thioredoxin, partial [Betaproteobacteria bacterium]
MIELKSRTHTVDDLGSAIELCYSKGWTDGLPVIPPTAERIAAMLEAGGLKPDQQLSFIENRQVSVTAEKVAINAVMAGCKPEYMPVITATVEALA